MITIGRFLQCNGFFISRNSHSSYAVRANEALAQTKKNETRTRTRKYEIRIRIMSSRIRRYPECYFKFSYFILLDFLMKIRIPTSCRRVSMVVLLHIGKSSPVIHFFIHFWAFANLVNIVYLIKILTNVCLICTCILGI